MTKAVTARIAGGLKNRRIQVRTAIGVGTTRIQPMKPRRFTEDFPAVELFTDLPTDALPQGNDEESARARNRALDHIAQGVARMDAALNAAINLLGMHTDQVALANRLTLVGKSAEGKAQAGEAAAVWPSDALRVRWRSAVARAREFNATRDAVIKALES